jgi:DNA polymerase-3 subunit delta
MKAEADIFLIFGDDDFLVEEAVARTLVHLKGRAGNDLAVEVVDCKEMGTAGAIAEIQSPSLFSMNKVTVLKRFQLAGQSKLAAELDASLAQGLAPGQYLVLVPDKVDKRIRVVKAIAKQGGLVELGALSHDGLARWIKERFSDEGKTIAPGLVEALIDLKGEEDLRGVNSEIEKIVTYVGSRKKVTQEDVEALVGRSKTEKVFELIGHVASHRVGEALETLGDLLETGESPIGIVLWLAREIRSLIQVRMFLEEERLGWKGDIQFPHFRSTVLPRFRDWVTSQGIDERDTFVRQKPYAAYLRFNEAAGFEAEGLVFLLEELLRANALLVSTSIKSNVVLERFVASLSVRS